MKHETITEKFCPHCNKKTAQSLELFTNESDPDEMEELIFRCTDCNNLTEAYIGDGSIVSRHHADLKNTHWTND